MIWIKKFNEELKPETYRDAARKLKKLGHKKRSTDLYKWADITKWREQVLELARFGKFNLNIGDKITDEFYLELNFIKDAFLDNIVEEDEIGYLSIFVGICPTSQETIEEIDKIYPESDMANGFYWTSIFSIKYKIVNNMIEIVGHEFEDYGDGIDGISFADRKTAVKFKNLLKSIFSDQTLNYPSGYNDVNSMYEVLENTILAAAGYSVDYGFSLEDVADYIGKIPVNELYKN